MAGWFVTLWAQAVELLGKGLSARFQLAETKRVDVKDRRAGRGRGRLYSLMVVGILGVVLPGVAGAQTVPDAPAITGITPGDGTLSVAFTAPASDGGSAITDYEYKLDSGSWLSAGVTASPVLISAGVANGTPYAVTIRAVNDVGGTKAGKGAASNSVNGTPVAAPTVPDAPTALVVTPGLTQLSVAFGAISDGGSAITDYEYKLDSGSWLSAGVTASPVVIGGLTNAQTYAVTIRAVNDVGGTKAGKGAASGSVNGTPGLPLAPTITGITPGNGTLSVAFTVPSSDGGDGIINYEYALNGGTWTSSGVTASPVLISAGVTNGTTYAVTIRAVNGIGSGATSNSVNGTPATVPDAPTALVVTPGLTQLSVAFTAPASDGGSAITDYEYKLDSGSWLSAGVTASPVVIGGLTNAQTYAVTIRAVNDVGGTKAGKGAASGSVNGTPGLPLAPTITGITPGNGTLSVAFTVPSSDGGDGIINYEYALNGGTWTSSGVTASPVLISAGVTNGTTYAVTIRAVNGIGSGATSNSVNGTPATVPDAPTALVVTPGLTQLSVAFTAPASDGGSAITDYEYKLDSGSWLSAGVTASPVVIGGLTNAQTYAVTIRAVNDVGGTKAGKGAASGSVNGTPGLPLAPTITGITPGNGTLSVAFTVPSSDGGDGIINYEYALNGGTWTSSGVTASPVLISAGVTNGTTYAVTIRAVNGIGSGATSNSVNGTPATVPDAPTALVVTPGLTQLSVAFTAPASDGGSAITDYEYKLDSGSWLSAGVTASPVVIGGLTNAQTYAVTIRAVNDVGGTKAGKGAASGSVNGTPGLPLAPTITGITPGNGTLSVAFTVPSSDGGDGIINYEYALNGGTWTSSGVTASPVLISAGVTNGTTYAVTIRAVNGIGSGATSNSVNGTPATVPDAPTALVVTPGLTQLSVAFTAPASDGGSAITDYEYKLDSGSWLSAGVTASPVVIGGLTNAQTYAVTIRAVNDVGGTKAGKGAASGSVNGTPGLPLAPTITGITPGNGTLSVAFTVPSSDGGDGIINYEYALNGGTWTSSGVTASPVLISAGVTNGTTYAVTIRAVNGIGSGATSNSVNGTPATVPDAPTALVVTPGLTQLSVAFTAPASDGGSAITDYEYKLDSGSWLSAGVTASPVVIGGLTNAQTYAVTIRAVNDVGGTKAGKGAASGSVNGTPGLPLAPTITGITPGNGTLSVAFTVPSSDGGDGIINYEYALNGGTWTSSGVTASPVLISAGVTNGTTYAVTIRAVNGIGSGATSNSVNGTPATVPDAPTALVVTPGLTQLSVAFTAPASDGGSAITDYEYKLDSGSWLSAGVTASPVVIGGLTNAQTYAVTIRAVNDVGGTKAGKGAASGSVNGTPGLPLAPTITGITPGNGTLSVAFTVPSSDGGDGIINYEYALNGGTWTSSGVTASPVLISAGVTNGTTYAVTIRAVNGIGSGATSNSVNGTPATVPDAPTALVVTPGLTQLSVAFTAPASDGGSAITDYEYKLDSGSWLSAGVTASPVVIGGLTNAQTYAVTIRAVNDVGGTKAGKGAASGSVNGTPGLPLAPTITGITPGNGTLSVAFSAPASDGGAAISNYKYSTDNGSTWVARTPAATTSPVVIVGLTNTTLYQVKLLAVNSVGDGAASGEVDGTPGAVVADAPTITGITSGNGQLSVAFSAPASDGGASISNYKYSTDNGSTWVARTPAATTSPVVIVGLTNTTLYQVKLLAVNSVGDGAASGEVDGTPGAVVADAPTITGITSGNGQLSVAFSAPASDGGASISNYKYSTDNGSTWVARTPAATTSPVVIVGLTNTTLYQVKLLAVNSVGDGAASAEVDGTPGAVVADAPTITGITSGNGQLSVAFSVPASDGGASISNYKYSTDNGSTWVARTPAATTSPVVIVGLTNTTLYQVKLLAVNSVGDGAASGEVDGTPGAVVADAPTITGITSGNGQLSVAFSAPASDGGSPVTDYEYALDGGSWVSAGTSSPILIGSLVNTTAYAVTLRAVNSVGPSVASGSVNGTPGAVVADAPTITGITSGNGQLSVAFSAPASDGGSPVTDYEYALDGGSWVSAGTSSPILIGSLVNTTAYAVTLRAVNSVGPSVASGSVNGTPGAVVADAPTITGITSGNGQLSVAFSAPASDGGASISNYKYSTDNGSTWVARTPAATTSPVVIVGLTNTTLYQVKLLAVNSVGDGAASAEVDGTPGAVVADAPTITGITSGNGQLSVAFSAPASDGGSPVTDYEYALDGGSWVSAGTSSPILIGSLVNTTAYAVTLRAVNSVGPSVASGSVNGTPGAVVADAPTITGITSGNGQLSVAFSAPASDGGASISNYKYSTDNGSTWVARTPAATTSPVVIVGLTNTTLYQVKLLAVNSVGDGAASGEVDGTPGAVVADAPTITGITSGNGQLSVAFSAPASDGGASISNYKYSTDNGSTWVARTPAATTSPVVIVGLTNTTLYQVKLLAVNSVGDGAASGEVDGTPGAVVADAPTITGITSGNGQLSVAFTAPASDGGSPVTDYEYALDGGSWVSAGTSSPILIGSLVNTTAYAVTLRAVNSVGPSVASGSVNGTPGAVVADAPTITGITSGNGQLSVAFTAPASDGGSPVTDYEYALDGGSWVSAGTSSPILIGSLVNTTAYAVTLRAVNSVGPSVASGSVNGTPGAVVADAPTITGITSGNGQLSVAFSAPASDGGASISNYKYSTDNGSTWVARTPAATTSPVVIVGLTNTTLYQVKLLAVNSVGDGAASAEVDGTPGAVVADAPTITGITSGNGQLSVAFSAPASDGGSPVTDYEYALDGGSWVSAGTSSPILIGSLVNTTAYAVTLRAVNSVGPSVASGSVNGTPGAVVADAPTITGITSGNGQLSVAFSAPASDGGASISNYKYSTDNGSTWVARTPAATTSPVVIVGLTNTTLYQVKLLAVNSVGDGAASAEVDGTPGAVVADAPTITGITSGNGQLSVAFSAPASDGGASISNYKYSTDNGSTWVARTPAATTSPVVIVGLTNTTLYQVKLLAVNSVGDGAASAEVDGTPGAVVADAPTITGITSGNGQLSVAFTAPASDGGSPVTDYEYALDGGSWVSAGTSSPILIGSLVNTTAYAVTLRAVNSVGPSVASGSVNGTPGAVVADAPTITGITSGNGQLSVAFTAPASDGGSPVTDYEYALDGGSWVSAGTSSPILIGSLVNTTAYAVTLRAVNSVGPSVASGSVNGTPGAVVADAPTITGITSGNGQLSVAFSAPASDGGASISNYKYSTDNGSTWVARTPAATTSPVVIVGLTNTTLYQVKLLAVNSVGDGAASAEVDGTPGAVVADAPTITGITSGNGQLSVAFSAPASDGGSPVTDYEYALDGGSWVSAGTSSPILIGSLVNTTAYAVTLRAVNSVGPSVASGSVNGTPGAVVADAPTITGITSGNGQLSVAFSAPASDGGASISNYKYSTDNGSTWVARTPAATTSPVVIVGLTNTTLYQVKLLAVNSVGDGAASAEVDGTPGAVVADAPTITGITSGNGQLSVAFSAPASDGGASISNYKYSTDNGSTWVARTPAATTSPVVIVGLTNTTLYQVKLLAVNSVGDGAASAEVDGTPGAVVADAPTITGITSGNGQLSVAFTAPASDGGSPVTDYEYALDGGSWVSAGTSSPILIGSLVNTTAYAVTLRAVNSVGPSVASGSVNGTPGAVVADAPTITGITSGNGQLSVAFTAPASDGGSPVTDYEYALDGGSWVSAGTSSPILIGSLVNTTAYAVTLRAVNSVGPSVASGSVNGTPGAVVADAPTITGITSGNGQLSVAFSAPASDGGASISNYKYSTDNGSTWVARTPAATTSPVVIVGLTNTTLYQVKLLAVNSVGDGAASAEVDGTPGAVVADAPTITGITSGNGQLSVAFSAPASDGGSPVTDYEYALDGGSWVSAGTSSPILIGSLVNTTAYAVTLRAVNSVGPSVASGSVNGTPGAVVADAPTITGITSGNGQLSVAFSAPASDGGASISNYKYSTDNGSTWVARTPAATTSPVVIVGLTNTTLYQVKLLAVNSVGDGAASGEVDGTPGAVVADAPTITGITSGNGQLSVAFSAPASDGGASISNYKYSTDNGSTWVARTPAATTSPVVIVGLTNTTLYQVKLLAVNSVGDGAASGEVDGTPGAVVADAPTITGITSGNGQLSVAFTAPASDGGSPVTDYEYALDGGSWVSAGTSSPILIGSLVNTTAYAVTLRAVNSVGPSVASGSVNGTPGAVVADAPTITGITSGNGQLSVAFTAPASDGGASISNYKYSTDNGSTWVARTPAATTSPVVIVGLTNTTLYQVKLLAVNSVGDGAASAEVDGTPADPNRAPVLTVPTSPVSGAEETLISFSVTATDPDGGTPTVTATGLPEGAVFTAGAFTWTPTAEQSGAYPVTFTASDGELTDVETVTITVGNVGVPGISLSANSLAMGSLNTTTSTLRTFTITNTGDGALSVTIAVTGADQAMFVPAPAEIVIPASESHEVTVTFTPTSAGPKEAALSIAHNAAGSPATVALTGTGIEGVSGTVHYANPTGQPVSHVTVTMQADNVQYVTTDAAGQFAFTTPSISFTLTASKEGDLRNAITGGDALLVLQRTAFLQPQAAQGDLATDVTGDGVSNNADALAILRHLAFFSSGVGQVGQWQFAPEDPNFIGYIAGDVDHSWSPGGATKSAVSSVAVSLNAVAGEAGEEVRVPLRLGSGAEAVSTLQATFTYDPTLLLYRRAETTEASRGYLLVANGETEGVVHLSAASIHGARMDGAFVELVFEVRDAGRFGTEGRRAEVHLTRAVVNDLTAISRGAAEVLVREKAPEGVQLLQNFPNPFNPVSQIRFGLPAETQVRLAVYNLLGQRVRVLAEGQMSAGYHTVTWDGRLEGGASAAGGVYFYRLDAAGFSETKRMVLVK